MLRIAYKLSELNFSNLMHVYLEGNIENGNVRHPYLPPPQRVAAAEQDFYQYLNEVFFRQKKSFYAILEATGEYRAALRIEPYQNGCLLCALETAPDDRRKGYASELVEQVVAYLSTLGDGVLYSHVSKRNKASLAVHKKCGFSIIFDYAVYSDGSVLQSYYTLSRHYKKSESI